MQSAADQAAFCSIFANPKRILILWSLAEEEKAVTAIARSIDASLQSTSQHLSLMKAAGIVQARRDGQTIYYRIADDSPRNRCGLLLEARELAAGF
jgi:ArsR family transcriptional regulator, virulence genes transcriptional regulator